MKKLIFSVLMFVLLAATLIFQTPNLVLAQGEDQWLTEVKEPEDYDFSFMVIGDTQIVTRDNPEELHHIYDYVLDNVESKNIQHVFGLGDITDKSYEIEWEAAVPEIKRLDGKVKYSVIRGNHDLKDVSYKLNQLSYFDTYFGMKNSFYSDEYIDCYKADDEDFYARNTVHEFEGAGNKYLVIALDVGADDDVLNWASEVVKAHPKHNVIISTHAYLSSAGDYYDASKSSPSSKYLGDSANNGDELWEKFVSKHKNIVMVLCGHSSTDRVLLRQSKGVHGNTVSEILIDPQGMDADMGPTGMVATFYVSDGGKKITVDYYSTVLGKYYRADNQYSFEVNVIGQTNLAIIFIIIGIVLVCGIATLLIIMKKRKTTQANS